MPRSRSQHKNGRPDRPWASRTRRADRLQLTATYNSLFRQDNISSGAVLTDRTQRIVPSGTMRLGARLGYRGHWHETDG